MSRPWVVFAVVVAQVALLSGIGDQARAASPGSIGRSDLRGRHVDKGFIPGVAANGLAGDRIGDIALGDAHVYWTHSPRRGGGPAGASMIGRARRDGSAADPSFLNVGAPAPTGLAVDSQYVYFAGVRSIGRVRFDGSGLERDFIPGVDPVGVAVNAEYIFWTTGYGSIGRASRNGTNVSPGFIPGPGRPTGGLAVDPTRLYWTGYCGDGPFCGSVVGRATVFGTNVDDGFITNRDQAGVSVWTDVAVGGGFVYWTQYGSFYTGAIGRADLNGTRVDPNFITGIGQTPTAVAVDDSHVYWAAYDERLGAQVSAEHEQGQSPKRIVVRVQVAASEALTAEAAGAILLDDSYALRPAEVAVAAGERTTLRLSPARQSEAARIADALDRGRHGAARVRVVLTDRPGNVKRKRLRVRIVGGQ